MSGATATDPCLQAVTAETLRAQVSTLGKQLGDFYSRAEGEGIAPPLQHHNHAHIPHYSHGALPSHYSSGQPSTVLGRMPDPSMAAQQRVGYQTHAPKADTSYGIPAAPGTSQHIQYSTGQAGSLYGTTAWQAYSQPGLKGLASAQRYPSTHSPGAHHTSSATHLGPSLGAGSTDPYHTGSTHSYQSMHSYQARPRPAHPSSPARGLAGVGHSDAPHAAGRSWSAGHTAGYSAPSSAQWAQPAPQQGLAGRRIPSDESLHGRGIRPAAPLQGGSGGGGSGALGQGRSVGVAAAGLAAREESRMHEMLQEVRHERRRLEDRILSGDSKGIQLQELRDELERQVGALSLQRDVLELETGGMTTARDTAAEAEHEVLVLREALSAEQHMVAQLHGLRSEMESKLSEVAASIDSLTSQHTQAMSGLTSERDVLSKKHTKALGKLTKAEGDLSATRFELEALRKEVHARELSLTEVRASAEVLQAASAQMQAQLSVSHRELEGRCHDLSRQLDEVRHDEAQASSALADTRQALHDTTNQLKESLTRTDFLRLEREKLLKAIQGEQTTVAGLRKQLETATEQAVAAEAARSQLESLSRQQVEALHREHDTRMMAVTRQFEAQLSAAEKAASDAVKQYDSSAHTGEKLLEVHTGLRRERDALWQELEGLRAELATTQQERDQLASKVGLLRTEVKRAMDDVTGDRDTRLSAASHHHDMELAQVRAHYESQAAAMDKEHSAHVNRLSQMVDRLKGELQDSQRAAEKHRGTVTLLKDQLAEALMLRDTLEREVVQERAYGEELGRLVAEMKAATRELR